VKCNSRRRAPGLHDSPVWSFDQRRGFFRWSQKRASRMLLRPYHGRQQDGTAAQSLAVQAVWASLPKVCAAEQSALGETHARMISRRLQMLCRSQISRRISSTSRFGRSMEPPGVCPIGFDISPPTVAGSLPVDDAGATMSARWTPACRGRLSARCSDSKVGGNTLRIRRERRFTVFFRGFFQSGGDQRPPSSTCHDPG